MSQSQFGFERRRTPLDQRDQGFSLVELLVVVAIIGVLAGLVLPALGKAQVKAQGIHCLSNTRQLTMGWLMYADDQDGRLCPNGGASKQGWVEGVLNFDYNFADNTNTIYLTEQPYAKLSPYVKSALLYRCPSDRSMARVKGQTSPRVRTLAMNDAVGSNAEGSFLPPNGGWKVFRKMNEITAPSPSQLWVLTEQHPDSINDARFMVDCSNRGASARWIDFPANFHNRACSFSFADGHSEMRRWVDPVTMPPNRYCGCLSHYAEDGYFVSCPNSPDLAWIQDRTSAKRN